MHPDLRRLSNGFESCLHGVDATRTQLRPSGDTPRWSIQQIVEHLLLTYTATSDNFTARLAKGSATKAQPTLGQRAGQFFLITLGLFPSGRKAPAIVVPSSNPVPLSGDEMLVQTTTELTRFDQLATKASAHFGKKRALTHPILGPLSVDQWRRFHLVHGEHHLKQVKAILAANGVQSSLISAASSGSTPSATGR